MGRVSSTTDQVNSENSFVSNVQFALIRLSRGRSISSSNSIAVSLAMRLGAESQLRKAVSSVEWAQIHPVSREGGPDGKWPVGGDTASLAHLRHC